MKPCSKCKVMTPQSGFYRHSKTKDELQSSCKKCCIKQTTEYFFKRREREPDYRKAYFKEYRKHYHAPYMRAYIAKSPKRKIDKNMSWQVWYALRAGKAGRRWEQLVGYSVKDLMIHLEKQFDENMSWDNYGSYWHVDHIKPRSAFKYMSSDDEQFKECWALDNLQPLEGLANLKKYNKIP